MKYFVIRGFTLIEVMISVVLLSILVSMTAPLSTLVESFRLDFLNQRLYASSMLARSESIKRGDIISICRSPTGTTCDTTNVNWAAGWVVFVNPNNNDTIDTGEEVIRVYNAIATNLRITWSAGNRLTFSPRGRPVSNGNFILCFDGRTASDLRLVTVNLTGQVRKATATGDCT